LSLGSSVAPGKHLSIGEGKTFFNQALTATSAKYSMNMSYLLDIDTSPSLLNTFKGNIQTRNCKLASHATLTSQNLLAGFLSRKEFLIFDYHLNKNYILLCSTCSGAAFLHLPLWFNLNNKRYFFITAFFFFYLDDSRLRLARQRYHSKGISQRFNDVTISQHK
jgi:hypothetical protein